MSVLGTLLAAGPALLRLFGNGKGGKIKETTDVIANVMDTISGKPTPEQQAALQSTVDSLDPSILASIKVELETLENERRRDNQQYDIAMHSEQQQTIRTSKDIKGVRPEIANRHSWFVFIYILIAEMAAAVDYGDGANWELALLIASPVLAWFGFRTWDKFSRAGGSN